MKKKVLYLWMLALASAPAWGLAPSDAPLAAVSPVIDGKLDDAAWQGALRMEGWLTAKPDYGKRPSEKTDMYLAYDRRNLYVGFRCWDSNPAGVKAALSKRDQIDADDWIGLVIDSFNDQQGGTMFICNPLGIQMDGTLNQDGNGDGALDLVWQSAGRIDDQGFVVEMAIPFRVLRFPFREVVTMGLMGVRQIPRKSEQEFCPEFNPERGSMLAQMRPLRFRGIEYQRTRELLPAVTFSQFDARREGSMRRESRHTDLGLTGKLGLTSDLTLDASYNPDFSQVESDAGQIDVNQRYALFYSEKRPFFLEGKEHFTFAGAMEQDPLGAVVHTRTIVDPLLGLKLTGKVGRRDVLSALVAVDEYPRQMALAEGGEDPRDAFVSILRYRRALKGDSFLGGFYTGREHDGSFNRVAGADGRLRLTPRALLEFHLLGSFSGNGGGAPRSRGDAFGLRYNYQTRSVYVETGLQHISPEFRTDLGYVMRTGLLQFPFFAMVTARPRSGFFQRVDAFYWSAHLRDQASGLFETTNFFVVRSFMPGNSQLRLEGILADEVFAGRRFNRNGWGLRGYSQLTKKLYLEGALRLQRRIFYDEAAPFPGRGASGGVGLVYQPSDQLNFGLDLSYADFRRLGGGGRVYEYAILRSRNTFQLNRHLFVRGIAEYNTYYRTITLDLLASFTYIPGTVVYLGYGSLYQKTSWDESRGGWQPGRDFHQDRRSLFFKASYLWRF